MIMKQVLIGLTLTCPLGALVPSAKAQVKVAFTNFQPDNGCQTVGYVPAYSYIYWECAVTGTIFTGFTSPNAFATAYADLQGYCSISFTIFGAWKGTPDEIEAHVFAAILPNYTAEDWETCLPTSTGGACVNAGNPPFPC